MYLALMAYIPGAITLGFVGFVVPLVLLPTVLSFSVAISAFCAAIFSRDLVRKWRGITIMVSELGYETVGSKDLTCEDWMVNTRIDADLSVAVQNALQTLLSQIHVEIREEFRTSSGPSDAGGNPPPISHMEKVFDVMGCEDAFKTRLVVYKFEGNALAWWKAYKQAKGGDAWLITMVNTRTDADLSAAIQNALQTLLPQIREEIREEFRTGSGSSNAGGNPPPLTIHTWLERFNKQKPHSFEKATAPVDAENWISHIEKIFDELMNS
nr:zinc finger, CCHC-type, retrotransposon Gag domain protein [Tanacetum cinerariifolium]